MMEKEPMQFSAPTPENTNEKEPITLTPEEASQIAITIPRYIEVQSRSHDMIFWTADDLKKFEKLNELYNKLTGNTGEHITLRHMREQFDLMQKQKQAPPETPYRRVVKGSPGGNWEDAAAQMLTTLDEVKQFMEEEIAIMIKLSDKGAESKTLTHLIRVYESVIKGYNLHTDAQRDMWRQALREVLSQSKYSSMIDTTLSS